MSSQSGVHAGRGLKALLLAGLLMSVVAPAQAQNQLPDGDGKAIVQRACTVCHGLGEIFRSGYQGAPSVISRSRIRLMEKSARNPTGSAPLDFRVAR